MITNYLLATALLMSVPNNASGGVSSPNGNVYYDEADTESFETAYELSYEETQYAEVYGRNDKYDYVKYTAKYSRHVFLTTFATDNMMVYVDVFLPSSVYGLEKPIVSYKTSDGLTELNTVFLKQGETVYFRVKCNGNCWWVGTLDLDPCPSGYAYVGYNKFHGYTMPHKGSATIYYAYDVSCFYKVPGQDFTYIDCFEEAIKLWESCGKVRLVYDDLKSHFRIKVGDYDDISVVNSKGLLSSSYYTTQFNIPGSLEYYEGMNEGYVHWDGSAVTVKDAVMGLAMAGFGAVLGLVALYEQMEMFNVMYYPIKPFGGALGDSDIASFMQLWGDANEK